MSKRKKALLLFPSFSVGGAQMVSAWTLQALRDDLEVHLATFDTSLPSAEQINRFFGTQLTQEDLRHHSVPVLRKDGVFRGPCRSVYVRQKLLARYAQRHRREYDLFISGFGYMSLPAPSYAYICFPQFKNTPPEIRAKGGLPDSFKRRMFRKVIDALFSIGYPTRDPDVLGCTSEWTARYIQQAWGIPAYAFYAPRVTAPVRSDQQKDPFRFCCIGRMSPDKELEWLFEVGELVARDVPEFHVDLICGGPDDPAYAASLSPRIQAASSWLQIHRNLSRNELNALVQRATYGIHCKQGEHFGIAVAEMTQFGVVPFIRSDGGALEIVNHEQDCICEDAEAASAKIKRLIEEPERTAALRARLQEHSALFSEDRFMEKVRTHCLPLVAHSRKTP